MLGSIFPFLPLAFHIVFTLKSRQYFFPSSRHGPPPCRLWSFLWTLWGEQRLGVFPWDSDLSRAPHIRRASKWAPPVSPTAITRLAELWGPGSYPPSHPRALQCYERLCPPTKCLCTCVTQELASWEEMDSQADLAHILEPSARQGKSMKMSWACTALSKPSHAGAVVSRWSLMGPGERHRQRALGEAISPGCRVMPRPRGVWSQPSSRNLLFPPPLIPVETPSASHWPRLKPVKWPLQPASGSLSSHQSPCPVGSLSETSFFLSHWLPPGWSSFCPISAATSSILHTVNKANISVQTLSRGSLWSQLEQDKLLSMAFRELPDLPPSFLPRTAAAPQPPAVYPPATLGFFLPKTHCRPSCLC